MLRLLFVMVATVLIGLGTGYFLWGSRVARLTESLSGLTLEMETLRARLASPDPAGADGAVRPSDELRVINESVAAMRAELAEHKTLLEKVSAAPAEAPAPTASDAATATAEMVRMRHELAACEADRKDLETKCAMGAARPSVPSPQGDNPVYRELAPLQPQR